VRCKGVTALLFFCRLELLIVASVLITALLSVQPTAAAQPDSVCEVGADPTVDLTRFDGKPITAVDIDIHGRVEVAALRRHMRLTPGQRFVGEVWQGDLQQLMNRGVFARIRTEVREAGQALQLSLCVETNWSLLPYIGAQTGAVPIVMLGANHGNLFGQLVEGGGYYMRRGPHNLGRGWLVVPNIASHGSLLDVEFVMTGELMNDYPSPAAMPDHLEGGYADYDRYRWSVPERGQEVLRRGFFVDFGYPLFQDWLLLSARYALLFETRYGLENLRRVIDASNRELPAPRLQRGPAEKTTLSLLSATAIAGRVDLIDNYRYLGHEARVVVATSNSSWGSGRDFLWLYAATRHFVRLSAGVDLAGRLTFGHSTSRDRRDLFNLGGYNLEPFVYNERNPGLLTMRGFRESQFAGANIAFANFEPRFDLFHDLDVPVVGNLSLTLAAYVDAGHAWQRSEEVFDDLYLSAGAGALVSLQNFRFTFLNWYYARTFRPFVSDQFFVFFTRPFF